MKANNGKKKKTADFRLLKVFFAPTVCHIHSLQTLRIVLRAFFPQQKQIHADFM